MNRICCAAMLLAFALSACNTVKGVARDVQSGARALERAAEQASD